MVLPECIPQDEWVDSIKYFGRTKFVRRQNAEYGVKVYRTYLIIS